MKMSTHACPVIVCLATAMLVMVLCLPDTPAQEGALPLVNSETLIRELTDSAPEKVGTRGIVIVPKTTESGHAVTSASPTVSLNNILFDLDSAVLRPSSVRQLDELAKALNSPELSGFRIAIEGHTCNLGTAEHNLSLSRARAVSVKQYLVSKEVGEDRLQTTGWGFLRPVASNASEESRALNRRVDFIKLENTAMLAMNLEERKPVLTRGLGVNVAQYIAVEFIGVKKDGATTFPLTPPLAELSSGDGFQIQLSVMESCHVYVLFQSSQGEVQWLMPEEGDVAQGRWCYFRDSITLPCPETFNVLDNNSGTELVVVLASPSPLNKAGDLPGLIREKGAALNSGVVSEEGMGGAVQTTVLAIDHKP